MSWPWRSDPQAKVPAELPWVRWRPERLGLRDPLGLWVLTVVDCFVFCGWDVVERAVQPALIPPLDPGEGGQLDLGGGAPRAVGADQLGLVQAVDRLGERVVERVAS